MTTNWPTLFDEITDQPADVAEHVHRIETDRGRGHIVLVGPAGHIGDAGIAFEDQGNWLHLWSGQGCRIEPAAARELSAALTWWADRKVSDG